jgi:hypothetical protein
MGVNPAGQIQSASNEAETTEWFAYLAVRLKYEINHLRLGEEQILERGKLVVAASIGRPLHHRLLQLIC